MTCIIFLSLYLFFCLVRLRYVTNPPQSQGHAQDKLKETDKALGRHLMQRHGMLGWSLAKLFVIPTRYLHVGSNLQPMRPCHSLPLPAPLGKPAPIQNPTKSRVLKEGPARNARHKMHYYVAAFLRTAPVVLKDPKTQHGREGSKKQRNALTCELPYPDALVPAAYKILVQKQQPKIDQTVINN
ncbi:hypothetical protein J3E69DRAFT_206643 [Trichoderma sp. SZMC 28015]